MEENIKKSFDKTMEQFDKTMDQFNQTIKIMNDSTSTTVSMEYTDFVPDKKKPLEFKIKVTARTEWKIIRIICFLPLKMIWNKLKSGSIFIKKGVLK